MPHFSNCDSETAGVRVKKLWLSQDTKDELYAGYCGGLPIPRCWYWYSILLYLYSNSSNDNDNDNDNDDKQQATTNKQTNNKQSTTNNKQHSTNNIQQTTNNRQTGVFFSKSSRLHLPTTLAKPPRLCIKRASVVGKCSRLHLLKNTRFRTHRKLMYSVPLGQDLVC